MYYREAGSGPPLILIMGWCANADWWPPAFADPLAEHFRLIMPDNRGAGRTGGNSKGFSIKSASEDIVALMDALGIGKAHLIGVSMGGMISQRLALDFPERVNRVVLACTTCGLPGGAPIGKEQFKLAWHYLTRRATRKRPYIANLLFTQPYMDREPGVAREAIRRIAIAPISRRAAWHQFKGIARFGVCRRLKKLQTPVLAITGRNDVMLPARNSSILARRIPNARAVILDEAGHGFFHEAADRAVPVILDFLRQEPAS